MDEMTAAARMASLGATRQMIAEDEFGALVAILVDTKAVPRNVMSAALERLANQMVAKARGEMESDVSLFPTELFARARSLGDQAVRLRTNAASAQ
jgi:hypothetical protein